MDLSLYRKFRPDTFQKIVRQEHIVQILKNQILSGTVGHAYLFCGPRGTGKTSVARILARAVNCTSPLEDGSPCGKCEACLALKKESLDIVEIDAASNNGVAEMRDLREKVQYPPVACKFKVYIIDEVHMLTDSAFNALLKTLEEPPRHVIFILATTEPHKVPATILSRCMRLDFKLIPEEDLERHLRGILEEIKKPYEEEAVSMIARAGAGSDRDMLSIAQTCISFGEKLTYDGVVKALGAADFFETADLCEALLSCDLSSTIEKTEELLKEGKSVGILLRDLSDMVNKILIAKNCRTAEKILSLPKEHFLRVQEIARAADNCALRRAADTFASAENGIRFSSSPRVALETALFTVASPQDELSIDSLLVRISALEKGRGVPPEDTERAEKREEKAPSARAEERESIDFDEGEFLMEEPVFDDYSAPPFDAPMQEEKKKKAHIEREAPTEVRNVPAPKEPAISHKEAVPPFAPAAPASSAATQETQPQGALMTAQMAYGKFMRALRKRPGGGVIFTMCMDLEAYFEGKTLVLLTENEIVERSLNKAEHQEIMKEIFSSLGVEDFVVRGKGKVKKEENASEKLKNDFKDYPIEFKD